jgi:mRNA interferase MazF
MFKRGEVYLASLYPKKGNEVGKLRPVVIYQTNMLNDCSHLTTTVLPLTTKLVSEAYPLRLRVSKRENLTKDSDVLCDQVRAIDNTRIVNNKLAILSFQELLMLDEQVKIILGMGE